MNQEEIFLYKSLTPYDQITFAKSIQVSLQLLGRDSCWCLKENSDSIFYGFNRSKAERLLYKGRDARPLILAIAGLFQTELKPVIVRRSFCTSKHCLNPSHYYWGSRGDVALENAKRANSRINTDLIAELREKNKSGLSSLQLSKTYKIPYHTVRRICNNEIYEEVNKQEDLNKTWDNVACFCRQLKKTYPSELKQFDFNFTVTNKLECPWHHKGETTHKGKFGLMGECLDCMEEIEKGRCTVDVGNFEMANDGTYWKAKSFWDQVDIKKEDECWPWLGSTRKHGTESIAYFPSPFHSGKTQSASRVAFWLSRGYTGKYRIFSRKSCKPFCCNPLHLTIKELKNCSPPNEIKTVRTRITNIFKHYQQRKKSTKA